MGQGNSEMDRMNPNQMNPSNFLSRHFSLVNKNNVSPNMNFRKVNTVTQMNFHEDENPSNILTIKLFLFK